MSRFFGVRRSVTVDGLTLIDPETVTQRFRRRRASGMRWAVILFGLVVIVLSLWARQ